MLARQCRHRHHLYDFRVRGRLCVPSDRVSGCRPLPAPVASRHPNCAGMAAPKNHLAEGGVTLFVPPRRRAAEHEPRDGEADPDPDLLPRQVVVGGPIGSGRTTIAAGIGSEFAFNKTKVRYLSFDTLLECASRSSSSHFEDDPGPANINYWPWSEAQVLIIDDIGPLISAREQQQRADLEKFQKAVHHDLATIKSVLARRHTVWVIGDLRPNGETATVTNSLGQFAGVVTDFCDAKQQPLVVELSALGSATSP